MSCVASLGLLALGATLGVRSVRNRRAQRPVSTIVRANEGPINSPGVDGSNSPETGCNCNCNTCRNSAGNNNQERRERNSIWKRLCNFRHGSDCNVAETGQCHCNGRPYEETPQEPVTTGLSAASFDCPVCLTELVLPRVAMCGHTVCTSCLAALFEHERRPMCPVCRRRIRTSIDRMPINFLVRACVEERVAQRGHHELDAYRAAELAARDRVGGPMPADDHANGSGGASGATSPARGSNNGVGANAPALALRLRPAWNWFKWTVIIVTEFGAFLVSLKEVLDASPARTRRYQRIV